MRQDNCELRVCAGGRPVREYGYDGRTLVEGRLDTPFTLTLKNHTADRVEAVVTVDGLSVLDGKAVTNQSRGYIIPAYDAVEVVGWRSSLETVNQFVFKTKGESYAAVVPGGSAANCGVVGVRFYAERQSAEAKKLAELQRKMDNLERDLDHERNKARAYPYVPIPYPVPVYPPRPYWEPSWHITCSGGGGSGSGTFVTSSAGDSGGLMRASFSAQAGEPLQSVPNVTVSNASSSDVPSMELGAGWGSAVADKVTMVEFRRGRLVQTLEIFYTSGSELERLGLKSNKEAKVAGWPSAFSFCAPPLAETSAVGPT